MNRSLRDTGIVSIKSNEDPFKSANPVSQPSILISSPKDFRVSRRKKACSVGSNFRPSLALDTSSKMLTLHRACPMSMAWPLCLSRFGR